MSFEMGLTESIVGGAKALGAKAAIFITTPAFGVLGLAAVIGWELYKGNQDEKENKRIAARGK